MLGKPTPEKLAQALGVNLEVLTLALELQSELLSREGNPGNTASVNDAHQALGESATILAIATAAYLESRAAPADAQDGLSPELLAEKAQVEAQKQRERRLRLQE